MIARLLAAWRHWRGRMIRRRNVRKQRSAQALLDRINGSSE
jgi:hypothetical protein